MLTIRTLGAATLAITLALPASRALGAEPTLTDIAACNEKAAAQTSGSALPRTANPAPPAGGSAPIVEGDKDLPKQGTSERSDPTGSIVTRSDDPLVKGMDAQRADDPAYRTAYRECMKARGERSR
jgi:hypothetical protein